MIDLNLIYPWIILGLSVSGAALTSGKSQKLRYYGFGIWIFSNFAIGIDYYFKGNMAMVLLFCVFYQIFNIRGVWSNR